MKNQSVTENFLSFPFFAQILKTSFLFSSGTFATIVLPMTHLASPLHAATCRCYSREELLHINAVAPPPASPDTCVVGSGI